MKILLLLGYGFSLVMGWVFVYMFFLLERHNALYGYLAIICFVISTILILIKILRCTEKSKDQNANIFIW